jgi:pimeloyl-ACP methyl ester carboxylesterase
MSDFLLIHGSCHGAWCWEAVIPALAAGGHRARAIDLPGRDGGAVTLGDYAAAILGALDGPTVVVGHSAGGYAITAAAEHDASRISGLVYLCAYVPQTGISLADMRRAGPRQPLRPAIRVAADGHSFAFDPALARDLLYHDCPQAVASAAVTRLCSEPVGPQETPLTLRASLNVPRHYIRCMEDRAIPPEYQTVMSAGLPHDAVSDLATGHSPFFAAPERLAEMLAQIMRTM